MRNIPVSVVVVTKNEERAIGRCLSSLQIFDEIIVVDSGSTDNTAAIAETAGARVVMFEWNGRYPKKRQWCLENVPFKHDHILFVDADEEMTSALAAEIAALDWMKDGYFIRGQYVIDGHTLRFGLMNNKLCLFDKNKFEFPAVDDLDLAGMGEIEGHYQPVPKYDGVSAGSIQPCVLHHAMDDMAGWHARHERYARWEAGMIARDAYPADPVAGREVIKRVFRRMVFRPYAAFLHSYLLKLGFLDGRPGWMMARSRFQYYRMVRDFSRQYKAGAQDFNIKSRA